MENLLVSEVGKSFLKILWESEKSIVLESEWLFLAPAINPCPGCSRQNCLQGGGCPAPGDTEGPSSAVGRWHSTEASPRDAECTLRISLSAAQAGSPPGTAKHFEDFYICLI